MSILWTDLLQKFQILNLHLKIVYNFLSSKAQQETNFFEGPMKTLLIGLLLIFSIPNFASNVKCDISARQEDGNYALVDSVTLGQHRHSFTSEIGRAIRGQDNLFINAIMGNDDSLDIALMSENATRFIGKTLAEAAGNVSGLKLTSARDGISVLCMKGDNLKVWEIK